MRGIFLLTLLLAGSAAATQWPVLANRQLDEVSGLSRSLRDPQVLWALNDGGGGPVLYRLGLRGEDYGRVNILNAMNFDWEDLTSFMHQGMPALLIGDVGDNQGTRSSVTLYAVSDPGRKGAAKLLWKVDFRYPDGPRDCEAIAVDGESGHIYLLSKRDRPPQLYRIALPVVSPVKMQTAERLGPVTSLPSVSADLTRDNPLAAYYFAMPTSISFAPDLRSVVVITPNDAYLFRRGANQPWLDALNGRPLPVALPKLRQTEAGTISNNGQHLYVTSEGRPAPLVKILLPAR